MRSWKTAAALASLMMDLRELWFGKPEVSVSKLKKSFNLIWTFITGKKPPQ